MELSRYFLWDTEENYKSVTQFSQSQTELCSPKLPDRKQFCYQLHGLIKECVSIPWTSVQVGHATRQAKQNSLWTHSVTSEIYVYLHVGICGTVSHIILFRLLYLIERNVPYGECRWFYLFTQRIRKTLRCYHLLESIWRRCGEFSIRGNWAQSDFPGEAPPCPLSSTSSAADYHNSVLTTQRRAARNSSLAHFQVSFCIIFIVITSDKDNSNTEKNGRLKYILSWNFRILNEN